MLTVPEAEARAQAFEEEHGFDVDEALRRFGRWHRRPRWRRLLAPRRRYGSVLEDGANRREDLSDARRRERQQQRVAEAEREEMFGEALLEAASKDPLPPGGFDAIRRYLDG
jgi:hypothetical protein